MKVNIYVRLHFLLIPSQSRHASRGRFRSFSLRVPVRARVPTPTTRRPTKPSPEQIREAAVAISYYLGDQVYAIVGGAACSLLGSTRETIDVDIVVPQGATRDARRRLRNEPTLFDVDNRTLHTYYRSDPRVEFEILTPPSLFRERFDDNTPVVLINGVKVLKPSLILNAKCNSILSRSSGEKRLADAADIKFCLRWCANNNAFPTAAEVPHADMEFVEWFIGAYGEAECWTNAGYNRETGMLSYPLRLKILSSADILVDRVVLVRFQSLIVCVKSVDCSSYQMLLYT
jgi:hypothetical protein